MECDKIQEQLSEYLDDTLPSADKAILAGHLKSCPKCSKSLADLEMAVRSLKALEEIIPPPWLTQKVMARVKEEAELTKKGLWQKLFYPLHVKLPIEALGLFLIALTALYVFKSMEPEMRTVTAPSEKSVAVPSERTVSEYAAKGKDLTLEKERKTLSQPPVAAQSKKEEAAAGASPQQEDSPLRAPQSKQPDYDKGQPVTEERAEPGKALEREMSVKSAPAPASLSAPGAASKESAAQGAGKMMSGLPGREDISISLKAGDIDSAKRDIKEVVSDLGGKVLREETVSDALIVTGELGPDKLQLFIDKLKTFGSVKEKTLRPIAGKDLLRIKITVSNQ